MATPNPPEIPTDENPASDQAPQETPGPVPPEETEGPPQPTPPPPPPPPPPQQSTTPEPTTPSETPTPSETSTPEPTTSSTSTSTSETTSSEPETTSTPTTSSTSSTSSETTESTSSSESSSATTLTLTSTELPTTSDSLPTATTDSPITSSTASLPSSTSESGGGGGLSAGGTIAVAVVVPVVSVALIIIALLFVWRKRKARKLAEEERKQEIEEYRFNPNNDPTLPAVGLAGHYDDGSGDAGYRGWGTTSNSRKLSTNLSSGAGMTVSDGGTAYGRVSPLDDNMQHPNDDQFRPVSGNSETIGDLHPVPVSASNRGDIRRGPSNASSAYSVGNHSDVSDDMGPPGAPLGSQYYDESAYYGGGSPHQGPYGDTSYGSQQPVIRDVQARRNTRIETPSVFPQHGNAGISQNF